MMIEQFAHGKIIDDSGRDLRGYTIVARSSGAPADDRLLHQIRSLADVGQVGDLRRYTGSDVAFTFGDYAIAGRFRRSPKPDARGYFLQEHYLLLDRSLFASLGHDFAYLLALLPPTIPWRSRFETLPSLPVPQRVQQEEEQRAIKVLDQQHHHLFQALQLALDGQPFAIVAPRNTQEQTLAFLETLGALLPPDCRARLSWAINVLNVARCKARVKVIFGGAAGTRGYTLIRLDTQGSSQPLTAGSESARSYVNTMRMYHSRFGVPALLRAVATTQIPANTPWSELAFPLATSLWCNTGPAILEKDLSSFTRPYSSGFYENMLPMLDGAEYKLSPEQRARFTVAVAAGVLDGVLPIQDAGRIPAQAGQCDATLLWSGLEQVLIPSPAEAGQPTSWDVLAVWRENRQFWNQMQAQRLLYRLLIQEISALANQPVQALHRLRQAARNGFVPSDVNYHIDLLKRAVAAAGHQPQPLLLAWIEMTIEPRAGLQVAQSVPSLAALLWPDRAAPYSYIISGLNKASANRIDQILAQRQPAELDTMADIFLALALMGERLKLPGFRSVQMLRTLDRQAGRLDSEDLGRLVSLLIQDVSNLNRDLVSVLAFLMLSTQHLALFKQWLTAHWTWIDTLINWLKTHAVLTPAYRSAVGIAIEWLQSPPNHVPSSARHKRLEEIFVCWTGLTRGTPEAVSELALLLLYDAFQGNGSTAKKRKGAIQRVAAAVGAAVRFGGNDRVDHVVAGIKFVRDNLFPGGNISPSSVEDLYRDKLAQAFRQTWTDRRLTGKLIKALNRAGLDYEAGWLRYWNAQQRGQEILNDIVTTLDQLTALQNRLTDLMEEAEGITSEQIYALLPAPEKREHLRQLCYRVGEQSPVLTRRLARFRAKIR